MMLEILVYPGVLFILIASMLYSGILRKLAARMQNRKGPPVWQPFWDFIKLLSKDTIQPEQARPGYNLWPTLGFVSVLVAALAIPIGGMAALNVPGDLIIVVYFLSFGSMCLYMSGLSSANPFGVIGAMRGITQMVGYEFPFLASLITVAVARGTLSLWNINFFQVNYGYLAFWYPFAFIAFFIAMIAKAEIPPFHTPTAHQEIVSGYYTEYSGTNLAMIELTHYIKLFALLALGVAVFFGGSATIWGFLLKTLVLLFAVVVFRVVMARLRIDQVFRLTWFFGIVALVDLVRVLL
jgi:NADH-quinone oxidoreductase subunit H